MAHAALVSLPRPWRRIGQQGVENVGQLLCVRASKGVVEEPSVSLYTEALPSGFLVAWGDRIKEHIAFFRSVLIALSVADQQDSTRGISPLGGDPEMLDLGAEFLPRNEIDIRVELMETPLPEQRILRSLRDNNGIAAVPDQRERFFGPDKRRHRTHMGVDLDVDGQAPFQEPGQFAILCARNLAFEGRVAQWKSRVDVGSQGIELGERNAGSLYAGVVHKQLKGAEQGREAIAAAGFGVKVCELGTGAEFLFARFQSPVLDDKGVEVLLLLHTHRVEYAAVGIDADKGIVPMG